MSIRASSIRKKFIAGAVAFSAVAAMGSTAMFANPANAVKFDYTVKLPKGPTNPNPAELTNRFDTMTMDREEIQSKISSIDMILSATKFAYTVASTNCDDPETKNAAVIAKNSYELQSRLVKTLEFALESGDYKGGTLDDGSGRSFRSIQPFECELGSIRPSKADTENPSNASSTEPFRSHYVADDNLRAREEAERCRRANAESEERAERQRNIDQERIRLEEEAEYERRQEQNRKQKVNKRYATRY